MKIIRYQNAQNEIHYAALQPDVSARDWQIKWGGQPVVPGQDL
jgi:hypothetical protein